MSASKKIVISASVLIVAAQAMSAAARESDAPLAVPSVESMSSGSEVLSRLDVRDALGQAFPDIARGYQVDGETLADRYRVAANAEGLDKDFTHGDNRDFSSTSPSRSTARCHSACHADGGGYC